MSTTRYGDHAIVIGGSMAGLLTARVLSDHFGRVTLLERDKLQDAPEARKGQPHARHLHALLAEGLDTMLHYFPDLQQGLLQSGAVMQDFCATGRWYAFGGYRKQFESGLLVMTMSRALLEWQVRQRVMALTNVDIRDECNVVRLLAHGEPKAVVGVEVADRAQFHRAELHADLVVDATGRGSPSPKWLKEMGYDAPPETTVRINVGYGTRIYRRDPNDALDNQLVMVTPQPPHNKRGAVMMPIEGDRWQLTAGGLVGHYPPTDEVGFLEYLRSLEVPDLYNAVKTLEPLSEIIPFRYPANQRRHYEKLARFPMGYLVLGDALCSFNPIYGQGMTSAAMQATALDQVLQTQPAPEQLPRAFFRAAAKVVDIPWQLTIGEDFRYPETEGQRPLGTKLLNAYVERVHRATHADTVVYAAFLEVMNLRKTPASLLHPKIVWRTLRHRETAQPPLAQPQAVSLNPASSRPNTPVPPRQS